MKRLLIVKVGDALPDAIARGEDFEHWIARGFGPLAVPPWIIDARQTRLMPAPDVIAGAVVTGSAAMVTERAEWSEALVPWLNALVAENVPVLGICYGHQLLAHALGGKVGDHPGGMQIGTVRLQKTQEAADDLLFGDMPRDFAAQAVHSQTVLRLPPGAARLASSDHEPHYAFRFGESAWGVQFHPEFNVEAMQSYIHKFAPDGAADPAPGPARSLAARGLGAQRLAQRLGPSEAAARVLERFARYALCRD
jgi:GMP synthase (glutamine-hydrolysing)